MKTRWAETRDYGRRLTNDEPCACEACAGLLEPGQGRVWHCTGRACGGEGHERGPRGETRAAYHCTCLDAQACRARLTPRAPSVRELAESAREAWARLAEEEAGCPGATAEPIAAPGARQTTAQGISLALISRIAEDWGAEPYEIEELLSDPVMLAAVAACEGAPTLSSERGGDHA